MPMAGSRSRKTEQRGGVRAGRLTEKSKSFHGKLPAAGSAKVELRRPKTQPDLFSGRSGGGLAVSSPSATGLVPRATKVLVNVTVKGSVGAVHVMVSPEATVGDIIAAAVQQYGKEARRPLLPTADPDAFNLHHSVFSLESLSGEEQLISLGSRNFFLCPKPQSATTATASCSREADKITKSSCLWLKFMDFLL